MIAVLSLLSLSIKFTFLSKPFPITICNNILGDDELFLIEEEKCVEGYCIDSTYNKLELPTPRTHVKVNLEVLDVIRIDDRKFSVELNMYFGVVWTEPRLKPPKPFKNGTARHVR